MKNSEKNRFDNLKFEDFKSLAQNESLSNFEKIGFPDSYREGLEDFIFEDVLKKLSNLNNVASLVVDIGPGCSGLPRKLIELCEKMSHEVHLFDSAEMLALLPDNDCIRKYSGSFPTETHDISVLYGRVDAILVYSVIQYVFVEGNIFSFLDECLNLLAPGGQLLIGDIPNESMRKRFLESEAGIKFHQKFTEDKSKPSITYNIIEHDKIDDSVVFAVIHRARQQGFHAYILPQGEALPLQNRREDILIVKP